MKLEIKPRAIINKLNNLNLNRLPLNNSRKKFTVAKENHRYKFPDIKMCKMNCKLIEIIV